MIGAAAGIDFMGIRERLARSGDLGTQFVGINSSLAEIRHRELLEGAGRQRLK